MEEVPAGGTTGCLERARVGTGISPVAGVTWVRLLWMLEWPQTFRARGGGGGQVQRGRGGSEFMPDISGHVVAIVAKLVVASRDRAPLLA